MNKKDEIDELLKNILIVVLAVGFITMLLHNLGILGLGSFPSLP